MIMCTLDFLLLIAFIIVSIILGKPLSYLNCFIMPSSSSSTSSALGFAQSLASSTLHNKGAARFLNYVGESRASCFEAKSIWGLSMALSYVSDFCVSDRPLMLISFLGSYSSALSSYSLLFSPSRRELRGIKGRMLSFEDLPSNAVPGEQSIACISGEA